MKTNGNAVWKFIRAFVNRIPAGARGYMKENWGAPFVLGFISLLVVAAFCLLMGFAGLANDMAVYAYCVLIVGVVLQLVNFLKCNKRKGDHWQ